MYDCKDAARQSAGCGCGVRVIAAGTGATLIQLTDDGADKKEEGQGLKIRKTG